MTSRERLLAVLHRQIPDCVPCCPDISNMVPCRLTGKPFWDIYAYQDPPLWKAHIDALNYFDIDGGLELSIPDPLESGTPDWEARVVHRFKDGGFATQKYFFSIGKWEKSVVVYTADNPPAWGVSPESIGLPAVPSEWEKLDGVKKWLSGMELWKHVREYMGDRGVIGLSSGITTNVIGCSADAIYAYYDDPGLFEEKSRQMMDYLETRMEKIAAMDLRPDFLFCGSSGSLVFQTPEILRQLALPLLKKATEMAADLGIPTHVHSCGPETALVAMAAEETKLTVIDPLEVAPMGDCVLKDLKKRYGNKIVLKGNLHTTDIMLNGSVDDVIRASRQAIDDAASGGGFILSTGDQCGRDTPDENIRAMVETARTYGKY